MNTNELISRLRKMATSALDDWIRAEEDREQTYFQGEYVAYSRAANLLETALNQE